MRENAGGLFQVRDITCGCGRRLRVPVLGDVYSLVREGIEAEKREESELLLKFALDEIERLRADAERYRWLRNEHQLLDPLCRLVWKFDDDRLCSDWVEVVNIDADIDAAIEEQK